MNAKHGNTPRARIHKRHSVYQFTGIFANRNIQERFIQWHTIFIGWIDR